MMVSSLRTGDPKHALKKYCVAGGRVVARAGEGHLTAPEETMILQLTLSNF